jgi:hypothetical protein
MNGSARRNRPGINARAMQTKSTEGTEQVSDGHRMVDAERQSFGVRTWLQCQSSVPRLARCRSHPAPSAGFVRIARALISGRSPSADSSIVRYDRADGRLPYDPINLIPSIIPMRRSSTDRLIVYR